MNLEALTVDSLVALIVAVMLIVAGFCVGLVYLAVNLH